MRASVVAQHAFVVISDTGIGMTREEQRRAFEYAYRGEAARASGAEGRGLGLALVRELLEAQGGKISLLSEPGRGLEVTIMFPLLRTGGRMTNPSVFIVDDDPGIIEAVAEVLSGEGYRVAGASDSRAATSGRPRGPARTSSSSTSTCPA